MLEARSLAAEDVLAKARIMALLVLGARREEVSFATIQARRLAAAVPHAPACSYRPTVLGAQAVSNPLFSIHSCTAHLPCAWDTVQQLSHGGWLPCMLLQFGCSAHICRGMLGRVLILTSVRAPARRTRWAWARATWRCGWCARLARSCWRRASTRCAARSR